MKVFMASTISLAIFNSRLPMCGTDNSMLSTSFLKRL